MSEVKFQRIIKVMREQLEWEINKGEVFYEHAKRVYDEPKNKAHELSVEDFVEAYRMQFKPKFPNHPTGGVGEEGDMFVFLKGDL